MIYTFAGGPLNFEALGFSLSKHSYIETYIIHMFVTGYPEKYTDLHQVTDQLELNIHLFLVTDHGNTSLEHLVPL